MRYLLDCGILLRVINRDDTEHSVVRAAMRRLKADGHATVSALQNLAEFWNVCTRPIAAVADWGFPSRTPAADFVWSNDSRRCCPIHRLPTRSGEGSFSTMVS